MDVDTAVKLVRDVELRLAFAAAEQSAGRAEGSSLLTAGESRGTPAAATAPTLAYSGPGSGATAALGLATGLDVSAAGHRQSRKVRRKRRRR
jgi:hypothetical protein